MPSAVKKTKATKVSKDANKDEEVKSPKFVSDSVSYCRNNLNSRKFYCDMFLMKFRGILARKETDKAQG